MAMIDAARFTALKARVQAECLRRKYNGSVVDYGGVDYYFKNQPAPDTIAAEEHFEKIAVPLNAINSDKIPYTDGDRIISDEEMTGHRVIARPAARVPVIQDAQDLVLAAAVPAAPAPVPADAMGVLVAPALAVAVAVVAAPAAPPAVPGPVLAHVRVIAR